MRNRFVQAALLIVIGVVLALGSNAFAGRTRKLVLPGWYPNALTVPPRTPDTPPPAVVAPVAPLATATAAPVSPAVTATDAPAATATTPVVAAPVPAAVTTPTPVAPAPATPTPASAASAASAAADLSRFQPHPDKAYVEISGEDAAALHRAGVLFLDARRTSVFDEGHIAGARSYSVWESDVDDKVNKLFEERSDPTSQNKPIVIYCSGGACEDSHMLAQKLWGIQFNNVYVYKDGYPDWVRRGGAVEK